MFKSVLSIAFILAATAAFGAETQHLKRTMLQQIDVPGSGYTTIVALTQIEPNWQVERHTHPGTEMTYVLEGGGDIFVEGKPVMHVKVGDHWMVPGGAPHYLKIGPRPTRLLVTYVLEKGKPLSSPFPDKKSIH